MRKLIYQFKPPCSKCPYKLGLIHTVINPCPVCKVNRYESFEWFQKKISGNKEERLNTAKRSFSMIHTGNIQDKIQEAKDTFSWQRNIRQHRWRSMAEYRGDAG